jgi:hypothetical protein
MLSAMNVAAALSLSAAPKRLAAAPRAAPLAAATVIVNLALLAFAAVRATGGTPNALGHLAYAPIVLAAFLFGWRGGVAAGLLMGGRGGVVGGPRGFEPAVPVTRIVVPTWIARAVTAAA